MEITICCYTVEQYMKEQDCTKEDVAEWYGEDITMLFFAEKGDDTGSFAGVQYDDGSCSIYGCRQDEEGITFQHMLEVLVGEFLYNYFG